MTVSTWKLVCCEVIIVIIMADHLKITVLPFSRCPDIIGDSYIVVKCDD